MAFTGTATPVRGVVGRRQRVPRFQRRDSELAGSGVVDVFVRGTDNGIYYKSWSSGGGWSSNWFSPPGAGQTIDQPACAWLPGVLYVVVRGTGGEVYWNSNNGVWSGWQDLHGQSASAPVLVSTPGLSRLDLVIQGADNGIYHKAFTLGSWSSSWDAPPGDGRASSKPAAGLFTAVQACSSVCYETDILLVVVRGTDNNVYGTYYEISSLIWASWFNLSGATLNAPTLAYYANGCPPGTMKDCNSLAALAVHGTDNAVYHDTYGYSGFSGWDSPGAQSRTALH